MRVLGQHKNVVNPVLVICPICKRAIKLANSGTIREFVRGHLKVHKDKGTQHGHHVYGAFLRSLYRVIQSCTKTMRQKMGDMFTRPFQLKNVYSRR